MYLLMRAVSAENAVRMLPSPSWLRTRAGDFQPVNRRFVPKLFNGLNAWAARFTDRSEAGVGTNRRQSMGRACKSCALLLRV